MTIAHLLAPHHLCLCCAVLRIDGTSATLRTAFYTALRRTRWRCSGVRVLLRGRLSPLNSCATRGGGSFVRFGCTYHAHCGAHALSLHYTAWTYRLHTVRTVPGRSEWFLPCRLRWLPRAPHFNLRFTFAATHTRLFEHQFLSRDAAFRHCLVRSVRFLRQNALRAAHYTPRGHAPTCLCAHACAHAAARLQRLRHFGLKEHALCARTTAPLFARPIHRLRTSWRTPVLLFSARYLVGLLNV